MWVCISLCMCVFVSLYVIGWGGREEEEEHGGPGKAAGPGMYVYMYMCVCVSVSLSMGWYRAAVRSLPDAHARASVLVRFIRSSTHTMIPTQMDAHAHTMKSTQMTCASIRSYTHYESHTDGRKAIVAEGGAGHRAGGEEGQEGVCV